MNRATDTQYCLKVARMKYWSVFLRYDYYEVKQEAAGLDSITVIFRKLILTPIRGAFIIKKSRVAEI